MPPRSSRSETPVLIAWALLLLWLVVVRVLPSLDAGGTSFPVYWLVGREILAGTPIEQLYDHAWVAEQLARHGFSPDRMLGPPTMGFPVLPVAWLPYAQARAAWLFGTAGATVLALWLCARSLPPWLGLALGAAFVVGRPTAAGFEVGQLYPLFLLLHVLAGRGWAADRPAAFGIPTALQVLCRGWYGLPQAVGALLAGRPRLAVAAGGVTLLGIVASLPVVGADAWRHFLTVGLHDAGAADTALVTAYQTLRSVALRLTTQVLPHAPDPALPGLGPWPWLLAAGTVLAVTVWAGRRQPPGSGSRGFALWTAASLLLAPVAEDYHMLLAAIPAAAVAAERRDRWLLLPALLLLLPAWDFTTPELWGGWRSLAAYPRVWGVLVLWLGLLRPSPTPAAPTPARSEDGLDAQRQAPDRGR
ncbi:MAG: DUF2029 domain-containing protein [Alphaproteobacteria bacterium]|nr:DUF2029 domain-containing protein [Alphaproteobacteria bacterium]